MGRDRQNECTSEKESCGSELASDCRRGMRNGEREALHVS